MEAPPTWLSQLCQLPTKKAKIQVLRERQLRTSFMDRFELEEYLQRLTWPWHFPWREEQRRILSHVVHDSSSAHQYDEIVLQAVFGSGKTTMMLAMIHCLLMHQQCDASQIYVLAFNVAIKNEIRRKVRPSKIHVSTYDSLMYKICVSLGMDEDTLRLPNFEGKRRTVLTHIGELPTDPTISYVFVDETQDLAYSSYLILRTFFPKAQFVFVGDIFQSIQQEPRESLLWFLLRQPLSSVSVRRHVVCMEITPRVPTLILEQIQTALSTYYPEFVQTIQQWQSHSKVTLCPSSTIQWHSFVSYQEVYEKVLVFCQTHPWHEIMILTFSSAITVRGSLGDVARLRRFLRSHHIAVNTNHKQMKDQCVFLSTANSSKGLERPHVFCVVTFPLEKAFANFSNDLVVNLVTVALTRCQSTVQIHVPAHHDRFSQVLSYYKACPQPHVMFPTICPPKKKSPKPLHTAIDYPLIDPLSSSSVRMRCTLEMEHGVTELLRQNILSFETKQLLRHDAKRIHREIMDQPIRIEEWKTEEGSTFLGLLCENIMFCLWTTQWPNPPCTDPTAMMIHHPMFHSCVPRIQAWQQEYRRFRQQHPSVIVPMHLQAVVDGCLLLSRLQIATYHKLFLPPVSSTLRTTFTRIVQDHYSIWQRQRPQGLSMTDLQVQQNIRMAWVTGIMDAAVLPKKGDTSLSHIMEIKASRSPEWRQNALVQSIVYGLMMGRSRMYIHLFNVCHVHVDTYHYHTPNLMDHRRRIQYDVLQWNVNCWLAKQMNLAHIRSTPACCIHQTFVIDFSETENMFAIGQFVSPTRFMLLQPRISWDDLVLLIQRYLQIGQVQRILLSYNCRDNTNDIPKEWPVVTLSRKMCTHNWSEYLQTCIGWSSENLDSSPPTPFDWNDPVHTMMVQISYWACEYHFSLFPHD